MMIRLAVLGVAAGGLAVLPPTTARYRIEQRSENHFDLSAFSQPEQVQTTAFAWFVSVSYTDSARGAVLHVVLDSLQVDLGSAPVAPASIDSAKGTVYHGFVDSRRKIQSLSPSKPSTYGAQFEAILKSFHPALKVGAKEGDAWTDTLDIELKTTQINNKSRSVRNYSMGGTGSWQGTDGTQIDVAYSEASQGSIQTPGGTADLEGKSTGTGTWYFGRDGHYLGGKSSSTGEGTVTVPTAPSPIPIKSTTTTTVTLIK